MASTAIRQAPLRWQAARLAFRQNTQPMRSFLNKPVIQQTWRVGWRLFRVGRFTVIAFGLGSVGFTLGCSYVSNDVDTFRQSQFLNLSEEWVAEDSKLGHGSAALTQRVGAIAGRLLAGARDHLEEVLPGLEPDDENESILAMMLTALTSKEGFLGNGYSHDEVKKMLDALRTKPWRIVVIESTFPNACVLATLPHCIFITSRMCLEATDEQLAFCIGHELGHMLAGHSFTNQFYSACARTLELCLLALVDPFYGLGDGVFVGAVGYLRRHALELPLARATEHQADVIGLHIAAKAGYPPQKAVSLLEYLHSYEMQHSDTLYTRLTQDRTHPHSLYRKQVLEAEYLPTFQSRFAEKEEKRGTTEVPFEPLESVKQLPFQHLIQRWFSRDSGVKSEREASPRMLESGSQKVNIIVDLVLAKSEREFNINFMN
ncbi:peptidase family M48-domain-containing protein [Chytriomyces sp. MP71]|nr:peptidase family M48-domain-containing protein [Chytriomyces sp. MP71]